MSFSTFEERLRYLKLDGKIGRETFGLDRYLNQIFYRSQRWKSARDKVIIRDDGLDLGAKGCSINGRVIVHHMNPLLVSDIENDSEFLLDPEYLISVSELTHNVIHYGNEERLFNIPIERKPNDTCPWRR
jgi:hypothetical protein